MYCRPSTSSSIHGMRYDFENLDNMWVGDNPYGIAGGMHYFGKDGKMAG